LFAHIPFLSQETLTMAHHWVEILAVITALGLFVYLGYALLRPEKF
jgi:K+-transporting ATPase KdpF subunit